MRLRLRSSQGISTIGAALNPTTATLSELQTEIATVTSIPILNQTLKFGFPPKPLAISPESSSKLLSELGIKDGEQIIVEGSPSSSSSQQSTPAPTKSEKGVPITDGMVVVREMKDDNSCLFRSVGYVIDHNAENHTKYRQVIPDAIRSDPIQFNEAILGQPINKYMDWIVKKDSWGGAIELFILSEKYQVEICSIDVQTCRVDRFGQGKFGKTVIVLYSGIHYDAVALTPSLDSPTAFDQTQFSEPLASRVVAAAVELAGIWNQKKKFTDLANFTLRCNVCKVGVKGEKGAQEHVKVTGHADFVEYSA